MFESHLVAVPDSAVSSMSRLVFGEFAGSIPGSGTFHY